MNSIRTILFAAILHAFVFQGCAPWQTTGTGSGGEAKMASISGSVIYPDGRPADGARVLVRPKSFVSNYLQAGPTRSALSIINAITNEAGAFTVDSVDTGKYCIEVNDQKSNAVILKCDITMQDTLVELHQDTLRPTGAITGIVIPAADSMAAVFAQVYGLDRIASMDPATKRFAINDVPQGSFAIRISSSSPSSTPQTISGVIVVSGNQTSIDTVLLPSLGAWKYSGKLLLNTTFSGANVLGNVYDFPVLIRLSHSKFVFSEAKQNGNDMCFAKQDGTLMQYEIENWDSANGTAEIWVKVDTVYGNDSMHSITMYWGNPNATSASNSAAVFDTAKGFGGVWHMGRAVNNIITDATKNHYNGTLSDTAPVPAQGTIGMGYQFDGIDNSISMKGTANSALNFPENGYYTLCAWVYADTLDYTPASDSVYANDMTIISKDNCQYALKTRTTNWSFDEFHNLSGWQATFAPATQRAWKFVVGVRQGTKQYLYVDGKCVVDSVQVFSPKNEPRTTIADVTIGKMPGKRWASLTTEGPGCFFNGTIDEVRIMTRAISADYIKLCFMNQKANDALVIFK
jgi:hypothetical protein